MHPIEKLHDDVDHFLRWLYPEISAGPIAELLQLADARRRRPQLDYGAARKICRQALQQAQPDSLDSVSNFTVGLVRTYLGSVYYAAGDLDEAIEQLNMASEEFQLHGRNRAVTEFALGAAYSWRNEPTQTYKHVTRDVLGTLKYGMDQARVDQVNKKWDEIQQRLNNPPPADQGPSGGLSSDVEKAVKPTERKLPDLTEPDLPQQRLSIAERIILPVAIAAVLVMGAVLAYILSNHNLWVLLGYVPAVSLATYLLVKRQECKAPRDCALVIESVDGLKVRWGPTAYYLWPFEEHLRALVPLYPLQYTTPEKSIQLGAGSKVDLRLLVYYRVDALNRAAICSADSSNDPASSASKDQVDALNHAKGQDEQSVLNSVYRVQLESTGTGDRSEGKRDQTSYTADDLRKIWEKRLLKDIIATLIEVLPGRTPDELAGQDILARDDIRNKVALRLKARVQRWGMKISDLGILGATASKT